MPSTLGFSPVSSSGSTFRSTYSGGNSPSYDRVTSIPGWLPPERSGELEEQYRNTNTLFDHSAYDLSSQRQQQRILTSSLNSGNAAAAEYANRARQAGGSGLGAGLVRAQAQTGARMAAGDIELKRQEFDAHQRELAATHAAGIARDLGQLRNTYLSTIVNYATNTDRTNAEFTSREHATSLEEAKFEEARNKGRGGPAYTVGTWNAQSPFNFGTMDEATRYFQEHQGQQTGYGYVPNNYIPWRG